MDKVDFDSLKDVKDEIIYKCENCTSDEILDLECDISDLEKVQSIRLHFVKFVPEGYSREQIESMSDVDIIALLNVYENHCF